jgi:NAD(P)H-hydrate repair Nnr-like enzyme with NAD(P)H-hydrate dehydratase domain
LAFVVTVEIDIDAPSKELERLIGKWDSEEEKFEKTIAFSLHYDVIVVMKGANAYHRCRKVYRNTTGNAALATAGSGCFNWNNYEFTGTVL